jgi:hypothetical protein
VLDRADPSFPRESPWAFLPAPERCARPCDGGRGGSSRQVTSRGPDPAGLGAAVRPARASKPCGHRAACSARTVRAGRCSCEADGVVQKDGDGHDGVSYQHMLPVRDDRR